MPSTSSPTKPTEMVRLTMIEIGSVAGFGTLAERLPDANRRHRYRLRDPAAVAAAPDGPALCRHVLRAVGALQVSQVTERCGTEVGIEEPGIPAYCFSMLHAGGMRLSLPGRTEAVEGGPARGLIHSGHHGTRAVTRDGTTRTNLWVARTVLDSALAAQLGEVPRAPLAFQPEINWSTGTGLSIGRLLFHAAAELERSDGMGAQPLALAAFTDLFVQTVLIGLPHNHSDRLLGLQAVGTPRHLRRAEAFMRSAARQPVRLRDIAEAAGCSVRSLHDAFRKFRETTPHQALQQIRLERAAADLQQGGETVGEVARRYGFTHAGRFAALYARRYGHRPQRWRDARAADE